eukprot:evm.model.scf_1374.1 EVM.evm.TU.scf_1374.1   scf_1374:19073-27619(-)
MSKKREKGPVSDNLPKPKTAAHTFLAAPHSHRQQAAGAPPSPGVFCSPSPQRPSPTSFSPRGPTPPARSLGRRADGAGDDAPGKHRRNFGASPNSGTESPMTEDDVAALGDRVEDLKVADGDGAAPVEKKKKKGDGEADGAQGAAGDEDDDAGNLLPLDLSKKKKKKKKDKKVRKFEFDDELDDAPVEGEQASEEPKGRYPWSGTTRDYSYDELLDRVYNVLKEKNPLLAKGRQKTSMKPPQVVREGTRKTVVLNFADLCKIMNRNTEHVMTFLIAELGTTGSLDGQSRIVLKGRFNSQSIETVLRRYINEYVLCDSCKSLDTLLDRDSATRLLHLRCQQCGASRTVSAIKSGYVARVGRRRR